MKAKLLLEYIGGERCRWAVFGEDGRLQLPLSSGSQEDFLRQLSVGADVLVIVPSADVQQRVLRFEENERKHVLKTARFELEEHLIDDVDDLHFAFADPQRDSVDVLLARDDKMAAWLQPLLDADVNIVSVLPQRMALPETDDTWTVLAGEEAVVLNRDFENGFSAHRNNARLAWNLSTRESEELPARIELYADSDEALQQTVQQMPQALGALVQARVAPWYVAADWGSLLARPFSLLQGSYAPSIPWAKLWQFWNKVIYLALAVLLLYTGSEFLKNNRLEAENLRLRQAINKVYADTFPGSHISDPEQQMRSKLKALQGDGGGSRFIPLFYTSSEVLAGFKSISLHSVNYDNRNGRMRVEILAKQFQDIEKLRSALQSAGVTAELANSNSVSDGVRARMTFSEQ